MRSNHYLVSDMSILLETMDKPITVKEFDGESIVVRVIENMDGCMFYPNKKGYLHVITIDSSGFDGMGMEYQA